MTKSKRPTGLTALAVINFIFVIGLLFSIATYFSTDLLAKAGLTVNLYTILSPIITAILLLTCGIGFIKMDYIMGYWFGNIFGVLSLLNIIVFNAIRGFSGFAGHIPSMVYPIILLFLLNLKYKEHFKA